MILRLYSAAIISGFSARSNGILNASKCHFRVPSEAQLVVCREEGAATHLSHKPLSHYGTGELDRRSEEKLEPEQVSFK